MLHLIGGIILIIIFILFVCYIICGDLIETLKVGLGVIAAIAIGGFGLWFLVSGIVKLTGG